MGDEGNDEVNTALLRSVQKEAGPLVQHNRGGEARVTLTPESSQRPRHTAPQSHDARSIPLSRC